MSEHVTAMDAPPLPPDGVFAGRYHIESTAATGASGWLLRARDSEVDVDVAFKLIAPEFVQSESDRSRLREAVQACRSIHHANLVRLYELHPDNSGVFYTMPFLEGLSLREIIDARAVKGLSFTVAEVLPLLGQLVLALNALAPFGPHGSIRPTNVTVTSEVLKLTGSPHFAGLPRDRFVARVRRLGMLPYLAPEVRDPEAPVEPSADVYALSVILCEMLTGVVDATGAAAAGAAHQRLPALLAGVVARGLADSPDDRFRNANDLLSALAETVTDAPSSPLALPNAERSHTPASGVRPGVRPGGRGATAIAVASAASSSASNERPKRQWLMWAVIAVALVVAAGATAWLMTRNTKAPRVRTGETLDLRVEPAAGDEPAEPSRRDVEKPRPESERKPEVAFRPAAPGASTSTATTTGTATATGNVSSPEALSPAAVDEPRSKAGGRVKNWVLRPQGKRKGRTPATGAGGAGPHSSITQPGAAGGAAATTTVLATQSPAAAADDAESEDNAAVATTPPVFISGPDAEYTVEALRHHVQGDMEVACVIGVQGEVRNCRVVRSLPYMDQAIIRALEARKYKPATRNGKPVDLEYTFNIRVTEPP